MIIRSSSVAPLSPYDLESIARSLGKPSRHGQGWVARCPAHDDKSPSLSLSVGLGGALLAYCHAGCSFEEIILALKQQGGLPHHQRKEVFSLRSPKSFPVKGQQNSEERRAYHQRKARELWQAAHPAQGTQVEHYLRSRLGAYFKDIPSTLRFLPHLLHRPSGHRYPCMIAAVTCGEEDQITAIHRTYLAPDGLGKAPVEPTKMFLGNARGGVIQLDSATHELIVCEGIEDGLSLQSLLGKPAWVAGSATFLENTTLPPLPLARFVYIAQDNDQAGQKAAGILAHRLQGEGRDIRILTPPPAYKDFNQIIQNNKHIDSSAEDSIEPQTKGNRSEF